MKTVCDWDLAVVRKDLATHNVSLFPDTIQKAMRWCVDRLVGSACCNCRGTVMDWDEIRGAAGFFIHASQLGRHATITATGRCSRCATCYGTSYIIPLGDLAPGTTAGSRGNND